MNGKPKALLQGSPGDPSSVTGASAGPEIAEERRLAQLNARLLTFNQLLVQINQAIELAPDEQSVLQSICDLCAKIPRILLTWIGRPGAEGRFEMLAKSGPVIGYLDGIHLSTDAAIPEGQGPAGRTWREQTPKFDFWLRGGNIVGQWRDAAERYGIVACATLPIQHDGRMWGELALYSAEEGVFEQELQGLLVAISRDVSFGLERVAERQRLRLLERAVTALSEGLAIADSEHQLTYVNPGFCAITGYSPEESVGRNCNFIQDVDADPLTVARMREALALGRRFDGEILNVRKDGSRFWNQLHLDAVRDAQGRITDYIGIQRDVTEFVAQRRAYRELERLYRALLHEADVLLRCDDEASMLTQTCAQLVTGTLFHAAWIGKPGADGVFEVLAMAGEGDELLESVKVPIDHPGSVSARAWRDGRTVYHNDYPAVLSVRPWLEVLQRHRWAAALATPVYRAGALWAVLVLVAPEHDVFNEASVELCERVSGLLGLGLDEFDRKDTLRALQDRESQFARTDYLTAVPNRRALDEYLSGAVARARRRHESLALGMIDVDDFKRINDTFGHALGDVLLQQLARRLHARLRNTDFIARLGGDEFVLVFEHLDADHAIDQLRVTLERVHTAVEAPFDLGEKARVSVGMSMGVALYPQDAQEGDILLRVADAALYQIKARKTDRVRWWSIGAEPPEPAETRESAFDPFDAESVSLLQCLDAGFLDSLLNDMGAAFHGFLAAGSQFAGILESLSAEELEHLRRAQAGHLLKTLRPQQSRSSLEDSARLLGRIHALVGLSGADLEKAYTQCEDLLRRKVEATVLVSRKRYRLLRAATARLRLDVQTQLAAMDETMGEYFGVLRTPVTGDAQNAYTASTMLEALARLPGIRHAIVMRPDDHGVLRIDALAGAESERLAQAIERDGLYANLNPRPGMEPGPNSMAWFTREIQVVTAYQHDRRLRPWLELAREYGWRSAAVVPIGDHHHVDSVLMLLGAYPHQFAPDWSRSWLELLRTRLEAKVPARSQLRNSLGPAQARLVRKRLYGEGLRMWVQPIIDLRTGAVTKIEALARLQLEDGTVLAPGQFLDAFGSQDLHILFRRGIQQALDLARELCQDGLEIDIGINLSPSTVLHSECPSWVERALLQARVAPRHLTLEILESEEMDAERSDEALHALAALGVRLALDDLGSGYSSLKRLATLPIDTVKIDQALVRELPHDPLKTIRMLSTLVRIGQDFARSTIVEGLEDASLVEAVRLLGAPLGQGYALARPMPAELFPAWLRNRTAEPVRVDALHSWAGALAYYWNAAQGGGPPASHDAGSCPLIRFFRTEGVTDAEVLHWHALVHSDADRHARKAGSDALLHWLAGRVSAAENR